MYLRTEKEVSRSRLSKARAQTGQTDRQTDATKRITGPHSRVVIGGENYVMNDEKSGFLRVICSALRAELRAVSSVVDRYQCCLYRQCSPVSFRKSLTFLAAAVNMAARSKRSTARGRGGTCR